jgi:hypothetical protein
MSHKVIQLKGAFLGWHAGKPLTYVITSYQLPRYLESRSCTVADPATSEALVAQNTAGPHGRALSADEILECYADSLAHMRFFRKEGVVLPSMDADC